MDVPPPSTVGSYDDLTAGLQQVRLKAGVSYRELHRRIARDRRRRSIPEIPAYDTVYRCLQPGRSRLDLELMLDVVRALEGDRACLDDWRAAWAAVGLRRLEIPGGDAAAEVREIVDDDSATRLVGRSSELAAITAQPGRWLLTGMAGVGKTALAMAAALDLIRSRRADRALLLPLAGFAERPAVGAAQAVETLLRQLGVPIEVIASTPPAARSELVAERLQTARVVLVLDDVGSTAQLDWLPDRDLAGGGEPSTWCLLTSRRRLRLPGRMGSVDLRPLRAEDALELLDLSPSDRRDPAAHRLVELAGGLPLALVLTRARIAGRSEWSLADQALRLDELRRLHRLDVGVDASLALSYASLGSDAAAVLRLLAGLPITDTTGSLITAWSEVTDTAAALAELHDRHLVQPTGPGRYGLHDLVAVFASARSLEEDAPSLRRAVLDRLLDVHAVTTGAAMALFAPHEVHRQPELPPVHPAVAFADADAAGRWLAAERTDLLQAVVFAVRHPETHDRPQHVVRMSILLFRYLDLHGWYDDAERLHGWAAAAAVSTDDRARTANMWGITAWSAGRLDEAEARLSTALTVYRATGDLDGEARVLVNLGGISRDRGDTDAALQYGYRSLELATRLGDRAGQSSAHTNLGVAHESREEHAEALEHHGRALRLAQELGDRFGAARALSNSADILLGLGELEQARLLQSACLELARVLDYHRLVADSLNHLATLDSLAGRHRAAIAGHQEALRLAAQRGLDCDVIDQHLAASRRRARQAGWDG
ncbi:MAG TPA: tetratricopeptide repeat protein [Microlunatus sp.]|nr:tetratricopeptide repeat protein [Microlunatus sp.]